MADPFLRLMWALPLVLALGGVAILVLKKRMTLNSSSVKAFGLARMKLIDELVLPEGSRLFLVDIAGSTHVVVSSDHQVSVSALDQAMAATRSQSPPASNKAQWLGKWLGVAAR